MYAVAHAHSSLHFCFSSVVRVELMLVYGFADEDLLLVKQVGFYLRLKQSSSALLRQHLFAATQCHVPQEMMNELAQSLRIAEDSFSIVLMYAAGQYTIVDFFSASSSSESVLQARTNPF